MVGIDNEKKPAASVLGAEKHKVFIATTRAASQVEGEFFSGNRGAEIGLASAVVSIPPNHKRGELERPARLPPDPERHFAIVEPEVYTNEAAFVRSVNGALSERDKGDRNVLLFVHGYNTSIGEALLRIAQFVEDSGYDGVPVLLSWASAGNPLKYVYDLNSALAARQDLLRAARIVGQSKAEQYDIMAHSMGAFLAMEAISQAELEGEFNRGKRIRNIILVAPDIDLVVFKKQLETITHDNQDFFVLISKDDSALSYSRAISGGVDRVGAADAEELAKLDVTVIDLSAIDDSRSGSHSKFFGSPEVVQLLGKGIRTSSRFGRRDNSELVEFIAGTPIRIISR
jgi:esterase/lipase superfamily enzyme